MGEVVEEHPSLFSVVTLEDGVHAAADRFEHGIDFFLAVPGYDNYDLPTVSLVALSPDKSRLFEPVDHASGRTSRESSPLGKVTGGERPRELQQVQAEEVGGVQSYGFRRRVPTENLGADVLAVRS